MFGKENSPMENLKELPSQFDRYENIKIHDQIFKVVDIAPETLKTNIPTIVVPGFSATPEALKDLILKTAEAGRRVISVYAPHGVDVEMKPANLPDIEQKKLELFLQVMETKNLEKVNVIANSEGSIYVTAAAILHPEKFENIVLIDPAGLIGKDSPLELLKRVLDDTKKEGVVKEELFQTGVRDADFPAPRSVGIQSILSNPKASWQEIKAIADSDITDALKEIHSHNIGISIIHGVDDQVFPMEKVQKMVDGNMIDGFYSVKGTHNSIYVYEPYGRAAEQALSALENRLLHEAGK